MGRAIYIYQINQKEFSEQISAFIQGDQGSSLQNWIIANKKNNPPKDIIREMASGNILAEDLSLIITWAWNEVKTDNLLSDLGIDPFWEITGTSASCTFMEEWQHFSQKENPEVDFFISETALNLFLRWLVYLSDTFQNRKTTFQHRQWYDQAIKIKERETTKKVELGDNYSGKWKIDYFNFLAFDFDQYLKKLHKEALYFLIDSY